MARERQFRVILLAVVRPEMAVADRGGVVLGAVRLGADGLALVDQVVALLAGRGRLAAGLPEPAARRAAAPGAGRGHRRRPGDHRPRRRHLAAALGRDPAILYRHAPSKAALLDGVAESVLAQHHVNPADPDWAAQLRTVARACRRLALAHPHAVPLLVTRPLATPLALRPPGTLRPLEDILTLLSRAGFTGPDALHIYRALFGFLRGHVLNELQELIDNPDETDDLLRLGLHLATRHTRRAACRAEARLAATRERRPTNYQGISTDMPDRGNRRGSLRSA